MYPSQFQVPPEVAAYGYTYVAIQRLMAVPSIERGFEPIIAIYDQIQNPFAAGPIDHAIVELGMNFLRDAPAGQVSMYWNTLEGLINGNIIITTAAVVSILFFLIGNKISTTTPVTPNHMVTVLMDALVQIGGYTPEQLQAWYDMFSEQVFVWSTPDDEFHGLVILALIQAYVNTHT